MPLRGYEVMVPYVRFLSEKDVSRISLELMPPDLGKYETTEEFARMKDDGVTSLQFNIEVWNKEKRAKIMPYKGNIPLEKYLEAILLASGIFGPGKIYSVLIAGLNNKEELREASYKIIESGGIPSIEIFRPLKGTLMERYNPKIDYASILELNRDVQKSLKEKYGQQIFNSLEGCLNCGGCNMIKPK